MFCSVQLASTEEWIDGKLAGNLGEVLIRCNNVLYIRGVKEEDEEENTKDTHMADEQRSKQAQDV